MREVAFCYGKPVFISGKEVEDAQKQIKMKSSSCFVIKISGRRA